MVKKTKTTKIEKSYKDKKTGEWKKLTIEYAKVNDRLLEFRAECPKGSIVTKPEILADGQMFFTSVIIKDLSDESSARATGTSYGTIKNDKGFEKLETLAVGRALAFLGYGADGAIASSEEMEDFYKYRNEKREEAIEKIKGAKDLEDLKAIWLSLGSLADKELIIIKDEMKSKLK